MYPNVLLHIDGEWVPGAAGRTLEVMNPASGEVNGLLAHAGIADLDRALEATTRGFALWRKVSPFDRSKVMRRAAELLRERAGDIARLMPLEQASRSRRPRWEAWRAAASSAGSPRKRAAFMAA